MQPISPRVEENVKGSPVEAKVSPKSSFRVGIIKYAQLRKTNTRGNNKVGDCP